MTKKKKKKKGKKRLTGAAREAHIRKKYQDQIDAIRALGGPGVERGFKIRLLQEQMRQELGLEPKIIDGRGGMT